MSSIISRKKPENIVVNLANIYCKHLPDLFKGLTLPTLTVSSFFEDFGLFFCWHLLKACRHFLATTFSLADGMIYCLGKGLNLQVLQQPPRTITVTEAFSCRANLSKKIRKGCWDKVAHMMVKTPQAQFEHPHAGYEVQACILLASEKRSK